MTGKEGQRAEIEPEQRSRGRRAGLGSPDTSSLRTVSQCPGGKLKVSAGLYFPPEVEG